MASTAEDDAPVYFGDDFGQKIDLTVRIREILRNYPEGTSIFKEMVQNADDAGATEVCFCLDYRQHASGRLAYQKLASFQGPSLLIYNNATFTNADFESIQRIGDSLKKDNSNGWKTGRFGVGFNSVYHVTDLPAFVSGSQLVFFDPQACHLPNVNPSNPGKMIDFMAHPELMASFPDQLTPFRSFGCDFTRSFEGTLFRLALRTDEQARRSKLSLRVQTPDHVGAMLDEFADSLHLVLLFLRNITKISVLEWREGAEAPVVLREAELVNVDAAIRAKRSLESINGSMGKNASFSDTGVVYDYMLEIDARRHAESAQVTNHKFAIFNQLGGGECARLANDPQNATQRLVPWGGVAVPISTNGEFVATSGVAFCFLPLPTQTYIPVHVNGYFELSSNRRDIWHGDGLSGDGLLRAQWNLALLQDVIGPCYTRALISLSKGGTLKPQDHVHLYPETMPPTPWDSLMRSVFKRVRTEACLYSDVGGGRWVAPVECAILRRDVPQYGDMLRWLTEDGLPIVSNLSSDLERLLLDTKTIPTYLEPHTLRSAYKVRRSVHSSNREAIRSIVAFVLGGLVPGTLGELDRVNFLPTGDGDLSTFHRVVQTVDTASLEHLCSMGFSRRHATKALEFAGGKNVERALNWILQNPEPVSESDSDVRTFLIPNAEEQKLLQHVKAHLVDVAAFDASNINLLSSAKASTILNVKKLDFDDFQELLALIFPQGWYGKRTVEWNQEDDSVLSEQWLRDLWMYIGPSDHLAAFCDKWPIVPTSAGVLASLSKMSGVLNPELIPAGVVACLKKLNVRMLIPNLFATFQPNPEVWQYIQQPTAAGILACVGVLIESNDARREGIDTLFRDATDHDRDQLRAFLMAGSSEDFGPEHKDICRCLPIFHGFKLVDNGDEGGVRWMNTETENETAPNLMGYSRSFVTANLPEGTTRLMCMGIGCTLLDERFIYVKEGDVEQWKFLRRLGVRGISKVEFVTQYLIPRLHDLPENSRIEAVCELLQELPSILEQDDDGHLATTLEGVPIFPSASGDLKRIGDLYDPEIDEFVGMMDEPFFPATELQDPQPLAILRSIGLQRVLSRRSILSLAVSIEQDHAKMKKNLQAAEEEQDSQDKEKQDNLRRRATTFFVYLDSHLDQLATSTIAERAAQKRARKNIKTKGLKFLRTFLGDEDDVAARSMRDAALMEQIEAEQREINDFLATLGVIEWVPVLEDRPFPILPWKQDAEHRIVAPPSRSCPEKLMWLCSSEYYVVKCPVHSEKLRAVLGWDDEIPMDSIAMQLKSISTNFEALNDSKGDHHMVWSAVFDIYKRLSHFFEAEVDGKDAVARVQQTLRDGGSYIWTGSKFAPSHKVAATTLVNAEPYLFTIPSELLHFRPLFKSIGVRERFSVGDYVDALGAMHAKHRMIANSEGDNQFGSAPPPTVKPLRSDELVVAIGLVQLVSDSLQHHSDYELYVPDTNGILANAATLTYDDAPWLDKSDATSPTGATMHFVHPKISNEVAAKLGAKSLRGQLLTANVDDSLLFRADGDVEAFGQSEALTKRISHILEQYPDGPNILNELIQNADDAGASRVRILYNNCSYGTSSLLSPAMAKWQGPALYCFNDAEFNDRDFINLARIGQASKLQRTRTTGRFGLGFNSVYHFTDLPTIVSASSIVMFDPHATHLPGISAANPGLKIRFVNSHLVHQFPDQFAPLTNVFGCDLRTHFKGTLFRFPLRSGEAADSSEIKRRTYSHREIAGLLSRFRTSITETMLFLRNVRHIEVYVQLNADEDPHLLFGTDVAADEGSAAWKEIEQFMSGGDKGAGSTELSSKQDFYARLRAIPEANLPSATQVIQVRTSARDGLDSILSALEEDVGSLQLSAPPSDVQATSLITESAQYLVCNRIGGGRARTLACAPENAHLKLIPWAGVAGRIDGVSVDGRAFCFLPLPVRAGLPVHVNGYFELSSNRRDIWHGDDMTGEGKLRSEWNASLLSDAVAPAYLTFLTAARDICGDDTEKYLSLFPTQLPSQPWNAIVHALFRIMKTHPVFTPYAKSVAPSGAIASAVSPGACVVIDDTLAEWEKLETALSSAGIPTVYLPDPLRKLVVQLDTVYGAMTPAFFRELIRGGRLFPFADENIAHRVIQLCLGDCIVTPGVATAPTPLSALDGLPILPLVDGSYGRLVVPDTADSNDTNQPSNFYYFGNALEEELLDRFSNRVIKSAYRSMFEALPAVFSATNIRTLSMDAIVSQFMPQIIGNHMEKLANGVCVLESRDGISEAQRYCQEWLRKLWQYADTIFSSGAEVPVVFTRLPLLPILRDENRTGWVPILNRFGIVIRHGDGFATTESDDARLRQSLVRAGVLTVDSSFVAGDNVVQWLLDRKYAQKLTPGGVLAALERFQALHDRRSFDVIFAQASDDDKLALATFLAAGGVSGIPETSESTLFDLPIFAVHANSISDVPGQHNSGYASLRRGGYLPDSSTDTRLLDDSFFRIESDSVRKFLRECDIEEWSDTKILLDHVLPKLALFEQQDPSLVDSTLVAALSKLPFHQAADTRFREAIQSQAIIPTRKRVFRRISDLYDPNSKELSNLVGENSLPDQAFATQDIVDILRTQGLRMSLSCHAVLESARSVEAIYDDDDTPGAKESALLKSRNLLTIVNKHFDTMAAAIRQDENATDFDSIGGIVDELRQVSWLPVCTKPIDELMPWKHTGENHRRLSNPEHTRPKHMAWFCSAALEILDGELTSQELLGGFKWDEPIDPAILVSQLQALAAQWEQSRSRIDIAVVDGSSEAARTRLFPLPEVRQMYEQLEEHRTANDAWTTSPLYQKLLHTKWIWTGKGFATVAQLALESEANLEPLLFSMPSEHIIPRSLLVSLNPKDAFNTADYLTALARLPKRAVLDKDLASACLRIYSLLEGKISEVVTAVAALSPGDVLLLDRAKRLVPAIELSFDDMEWNTSLEIRRDTAFVATEISNEVARAFGAASLHSKLAETSIVSRRVVCPSVFALQSVLPPANAWHHRFLSESLLAAERFGASQLHFFVDYRHHEAQKVVQPSFQPLQNEALCLHLKGIVLNDRAINTLFGGESSRVGLLCGFFGSDCMQILSGDAFYMLDPTGAYLSPTPASGLGNESDQERGKVGIGRRYDVLGQAFRQYSDQLLPFTNLPTCQGNVTQGTRDTLIRFPWRKTRSALSKFVMTRGRVAKLVQYLKSQLYQTLVFTASVHRISVWSLGVESEFARHCHGEASLDQPENVLRKRTTTQHNDEWKRKNFSFQSFFKSVVTPENQIDFVVNLEIENERFCDTWLLSDNIGYGRSRDIACMSVHEALHSTPYVSVACHLLRDGNPAPRLRGSLFKIVDTGQSLGLPVHVNGCFKKALKESQLMITATNSGDKQTDTLSGSEATIKAQWNRVLLEDGVVDAYLKLLLVAKQRLVGSFPKALYNVWPRQQKVGESGIALLIQSHLYRQLGNQELFLCSDSQFRSLSNGYLLDTANMDMQVASFAQLHFPAFDIPKAILTDCTSFLPSRVHKLTPQAMRRFLRNMDTSSMHISVCLSIFEYCLSDLPSPLPVESHPIWTEFNGLPILPLEDGSIGVIRVNQRGRFVLATYNQVMLLEPLRQMFVSLAARRRLFKYFGDSRFASVMGLSAFSIKTLADNMDQVLPATWKYKAIVEWDPSSVNGISRLWLHRFWQEVRYERRSLGYFAAWPLIPVQGSRLVSCGKPDAALCVWRDSCDYDLARDLKSEYTESESTHESRLGELETERKQLMELAAHEQQAEMNDMSSESGDEDADIAEMSSDGEEDATDEHVADDGSDDNVNDAGDDTRATSTQNDGSVVAVEDEDFGTVTVELEELPVSDDQPQANEPESDHGDDIVSEHSPIVTDEASQIVPTDDTALQGSSMEVEVDEEENGTESSAVDAFCSRETLHRILETIDLACVELAYFDGEERNLTLRSCDVATAILDAAFALGDQHTVTWDALSDDQLTLLVEYFSLHGDTFGGYTRVHFTKLKQLPIYMTTSGTRTALSNGTFYLVPPEIDLTELPLPPNSRQWFLRSNPSLVGFFKELGVEEMSNAELLGFVLPHFSELQEEQRDQVLLLILQKWQTLRGNAQLVRVLKETALFCDASSGTYHPASAFYDPRNKFMSSIYSDIAGIPLSGRFRDPSWLDVLGEIGLRTEVTIDMFIECAQRIDALSSAKRCLSSEDERLVVTVHQYFVQNFEKFDRSRTFFDSISTIAFVPALVYDKTTGSTSGARNSGSYSARLVVRTYRECVTPDDQALSFSTMPVMHGAALPPRVLWSRLGISSPPPKDKVLAHLFAITGHSNGIDVTSSQRLDWQFFLPMIGVFQEIFKYLQSHWAELTGSEQRQLSSAAVIPVGSELVKGSRLFFHLAENLAPLMFEVPRAFGAYDTLFRHMGSKDVPSAEDYIRLLEDLHAECRGNALNLNELLAVGRIVSLLADALAETGQSIEADDRQRMFLPSTTSVMQSVLSMAHNDAPWLCARIDLNEFHLVHPRISARSCQLLGVPALSAVVTEELDRGDASSDGMPVSPLLSPLSDSIAHMNSVLSSTQFGAGLRRIITVQQQKMTSSYDPFGVGPDFEDLNRRIIALGTFSVEEVGTLHSRFIAHVGSPPRGIDVTKESTRGGSLSFVDHHRRVIFIGSKALSTHAGMRASQLVASSINQMLGGIIQDCAAVESILVCDLTEIPSVLQLLNISEDPALIAEKLRGILGEPLTDTDQATVELAPLRSCLPGELVAVEVDGTLHYAKIIDIQTSATSVGNYHVRLSKTETRWIPASEMYFFRSGRVGGSDDVHAEQLAMIEEDVVSRLTDSTSATGVAALSALPAAVTPIVTDQYGGSSVNANLMSVASDSPVPSSNVISAVNELLSRLNVSLSTDFVEVIEEVQRLKQQLELAEEGRRIAAAQIDVAIQEKKEAQDSLVCAICLENRVDRVLIPCGHIYCGECVERLPRPSCPLCREHIGSSSTFHITS